MTVSMSQSPRILNIKVLFRSGVERTFQSTILETMTDEEFHEFLKELKNLISALYKGDATDANLAFGEHILIRLGDTSAISLKVP